MSERAFVFDYNNNSTEKHSLDNVRSGWVESAKVEKKDKCIVKYIFYILILHMISALSYCEEHLFDVNFKLNYYT